MTEKKTFRRLREETTTPQPSVEQLFAKLGLAVPEEQQPVRNRQKRWIPAVALGCTAAIAIGVCIPVYLHMQENNDITHPIQAFSAPDKENRKLVWGYDGNVSDEGLYTISFAMQKELDKPENRDALFCVSVNLNGVPYSNDFIYEGKSINEWINIAEDYRIKLEKLGKKKAKMEYEEYSRQFDELNEPYNRYKAIIEAAQEMALQNISKKTQQYAEELYQKLGIKKETFIYNGSEPETYRLFDARLTKEQIETLANAKECPHRIDLAIPPRPTGYEQKIADSLTVMLEYQPQETYYVRVNSVLCKKIAYGNNEYNKDLIRKLKDEEITQKFGDNFLADIRKRHGIEEVYIPYWTTGYWWPTKEKAIVKNYIGDWFVESYIAENGEKEMMYSGGFFEAKLTKAQITELAKDSDVRSIYPAASEYHDYSDASE